MSNIPANPWLNLSERSPYILPADQLALLRMNKKNNLRFEPLPEPYIGSPDQSRVLLLVLNPGFTQTDIGLNLKSSLFLNQARANMVHESSPAFYYFTPGLEFTGGNIWWSRILKPLINDGISRQQLSEAVQVVQFFPYHSVTYQRLPEYLPSQAYSFDLVRRAIHRSIPIIVMRSEHLWLEAVPELKKYDYAKTKNVRNPVVSPANIGDTAYSLIKESIIREGLITS